MTLNADASALVKRYIVEPGTPEVQAILGSTRSIACSRLGFVEIARANSLGAPADAARLLERFHEDWARIAVVEVDDGTARQAALFAAALGLRSLDAIHLASAHLLGPETLVLTWDRRLWQAARGLGMAALPEGLA